MVFAIAMTNARSVTDALNEHSYLHPRSNIYDRCWNDVKKIDAEYAKLAGDASEAEIEKSKSDLTSLEAIVGAKERIEMLADDLIAYYEDRQYVLTGKAMIVCMTRRIAINLYKKLLEKRPEWDKKVKVVLTTKRDQDKVPNLQAAYEVCMAKLCRILMNICLDGK